MKKLALLLGTLALSACATMKNDNVAMYGSMWFDAAGYPLTKNLSCQVTGETEEVQCGGMTRDGKAAAMSGSLSGTQPFVGTVDGRKVFTRTFAK